MTSDRFCIEFDNEDHLFIAGREGWREPICRDCGKSIPWVLDMMSFTSRGGRHEAVHAACAWLPEGFDQQRTRSAALHTEVTT